MSATHSTPGELAEKLLAARRNRTRLPIDTAPPASFADAYETQARVTAALSEKVEAWKIGLAPDGTVFAGPMYTTDLRVLHAAPTGFIAAEVEYAIRMAKDLPQREITRAEALESLKSGRINSAAPIIALQWLELNQSRLMERWGLKSG